MQVSKKFKNNNFCNVYNNIHNVHFQPFSYNRIIEKERGNFYGNDIAVVRGRL